MHDIFGLEQIKRQFILDTCKRVASVYGFEEIATPLVEDESVFSRTLGSDSDVVSKEMYTFPDRSQNMLSLRPEGTAGVVRAAINHKHSLGSRLYYCGPMFRYERPQKGRSRQFYQFGIEHMHSPHHLADVHAIEMANTILEQLQIDNFSLQINSLGDEVSRFKYRQVLESYLTKHKDSLSPLSRSRIERGSVLRVLDSKESEDAIVVQDAPTLDSYLSPESSARFQRVLEGLGVLGLPYTVNQRLVRGLDYYNDTCFEFVATDPQTGSQQAIVAGGRYDKLAEIMGGQPTPGVGWAAGIERLSYLLNDALLPAPHRPIAIIPVSDSDSTDEIWAFAMRLSHSFRATGVPAILSYETNAAKHTKRAAKENCKYCVYIGTNELASGTVLVKDLDSGKQFECSVEELKAMFPLYIPQ
jgi:histidyl-tRNA synthetase